MTWLLDSMNQEIFRLSDTPMTAISMIVMAIIALISAVTGYPLARLVQRAVGLSGATLTVGPATTGKGLGAFGGVYTPSILTILGVIMYLRLGWVVGSAGLALTLMIVVVAHLITIATGLSIASIATNRRVGAGGAYYIISRSLGAPAGAAIGIPLFFAQALSVTFYVVGFTEALASLVPNLPEVAVSLAVCLVLTMVSLRGADLAIKTQYFVMGMIVFSLVSFFAGRPADAPATFDWWAQQSGSFGDIFAVFFPAVTGVMAGVGMSGDLADPRRALPKGTLYAILTGFIVYMVFPIWLAKNASPAALLTDRNIVWQISRFPSLIHIGVWGATLSSALGSILTAPRTLQALAADGLAPRILARGSGANNEPRIGILLTFALAQSGILLGELDVIAPILTMFFLATYGVTNLACGLERWAASPSFRPEFRVSAAVSLCGAFACFYVMSIINMLAMVSALVICATIYIIAQRRLLGTTYGDARHGIWSALVRSALYRLRRSDFHPLNWRPNLVIMGGDQEKRAYLLQLGSSIVQDRGIVTYFQLIKGDVHQIADRRQVLRKAIDEDIGERFPHVFCRVDIVPDVYQGVVTVAQSYGVGSFEANTVMLGWPKHREHRVAYIEMLRKLVTLDRSLLVVRYDSVGKLGHRRTIHIWWGGLQQNGGLMLLLAFLLTADHSWRQANVSLMTIVDSEPAQREAEAALARILKDARVVAQPRTFLRAQRSVADIIHQESRDADLVVMGLAIPEGEREQIDSFFERMEVILKDMPTTILVHSARTFKGEPVLFDSDGD